MEMEYQGSRVGHSPTHPDCSQHRTIHDQRRSGRGVGEPHWFMAYSRTLQQVGEAAHGWKWEWPVGKTPEVRVPHWSTPSGRRLVQISLWPTVIQLCWEPAPRGIFHKRKEGPVAYVITFMDELAVWVPSLDAWNQFVWPPATAVPRALTEVESYGYCCGQAVDPGPVMLAAQFRVTDKAGTYLCMAWAPVFEGSVLAYKPTKDEAEWVPMCGLANDLTWTKERSTMALANYILRVPQEAARITRLGAHRLVSWPTDSSMSEEEEEEEEWDPKLLTTDAEPEGVRRMKKGPDRQTRKMSRNQIGGGTCETGRWSWGKRRDWHMMTCSQIPTPW